MTLLDGPATEISEPGAVDAFDSLFGASASTPFLLADLESCQQWVAWREETRKGKLTKVPYNPGKMSAGAKANDRTTWSSQAVATAAAERLLAGGRKGGIGIQLGEIDCRTDILLGGVDLDDAFDILGDLEPWAAEVVSAFESYTEISPSGNGLKVFFAYRAEDRAALQAAMVGPEGKVRHRVAWSRGSHCEIALDVDRRYYAVTGREWPASPPTVAPVDLKTLLWLLREAGPAFLARAEGTTSETAAEPAPARDESGSGYGFRFLADQATLGFDKAASLEALRSDAGKAGEWAARTTQRELNRTWKRALEFAESRRPVDAQTAFEEEESDETVAVAGVDPVTARLNRRHAVVVIRGRSLISTEGLDGSVDFGTTSDLRVFYLNDRVPAGDGKREPASDRWLRNPRRRTYQNGVTFAPGGAPAGMLNLWRGWAVEPDPTGSCELFLHHIKSVVCRGDETHTAYVIGWLAHLVQRPDDKPGVGLVLKGGKGAGKDSVAEYVARMIGRRHAPTVAESDHIVGKFNARLESAILLHVQEGSWAGDRKAEGVLKYLCTSDRIEIERKGIDSINLPSVLRLFISANADWVVPASPDERRWAVFNVSDRRRNDESYFTALRSEMSGKGPAALLHYLRAFDLTGFNVRQAPETEGLRDQKLASLRNIERWWFDALSRGEVAIGWDDSSTWSERPLAVGRDTLRGGYVEWLKTQKYESDMLDDARFGRRIRELLPEIGEKRLRSGGGPRVRQYTIPALVDCRAAFDRWLGSPVEWEALS